MLPVVMKLTVDNFAFIKHADVTIDGITVIAGNNNTGKSTIGKVLFSMFNAFSDIEVKIERLRKRAIINAIMSVVSAVHGAFRQVPKPWKARYVKGNIETESLAEVDWDDFYSTTKKNFPEFENPENLSSLKRAIDRILHWPSEKLQEEAVMTSVSSIFNNQINSLYSPESSATAKLSIKEKEISISIDDNATCSNLASIQLQNNALYYNSPYIIDSIGYSSEQSSIAERKLKEALYSYMDNITDEDSILERSMQKERLEKVMKGVSQITDGTITKEQGEYAIRIAGMSAPLKMKNLSTGLKALMILRMLIESSKLQQKDVLILDEPEIHLHPTWQLKYAELIVLLQKEFELSVVITTHSHFFLNAIETYSLKYETHDKLKLYLTEVEDGGAVVKDVTEEPEQIYSIMAEAVATLRSERIEQTE